MKMVKNILLIVLGNLFISVGVAGFLVPSGLISGGATGLSLTVSKAFSLPLTACVWCASILFFLIGFLVLGKEFAFSTLVSSVAYPLFFHLATLLFGRIGVITGDLVLCTAFAGILLGVGIGLVLRGGASTGGTDVIAVALHKKFGFSLSAVMYLTDGVILCLQFPFSRAEQILYGLLVALIYTYLAEKVILFGQDKIQIMIYSGKQQEINRLLLSDFDKGSTLFPIRGGYSGKEGYAIQSVIQKRSLFSVREAVLRIDPQAFVVINPVSEVNGRGFTLNKHFGEPEAK